MMVVKLKVLCSICLMKTHPPNVIVGNGLKRFACTASTSSDENKPTTSVIADFAPKSAAGGSMDTTTGLDNLVLTQNVTKNEGNKEHFTIQVKDCQYFTLKFAK